MIDSALTRTRQTQQHPETEWAQWAAEPAELVRRVCAQLMATAGQEMKPCDVWDRLRQGEERLRKLVSTLVDAGLHVGDSTTAPFISQYAGWLQATNFDGVSRDEHGDAARARARLGNCLVDRLCREQDFQAIIHDLPEGDEVDSDTQDSSASSPSTPDTNPTGGSFMTTEDSECSDCSISDGEDTEAPTPSERDRSSRAAQPSLLELQYMEQQQLLEKQRQQQRRRAMQRREYDRRQQVADQSLKWHRPHSAECRRDGYSRRFSSPTIGYAQHPLWQTCRRDAFSPRHQHMSWPGNFVQLW